MTPRCTDLDPFFDGELEPDQHAAFRDHLVTCERCQWVLHGRMQEAVVAYNDDPVLARGSRRSVPRIPAGELGPLAAEPAAAIATSGAAAETVAASSEAAHVAAARDAAPAGDAAAASNAACTPSAASSDAAHAAAAGVMRVDADPVAATGSDAAAVVTAHPAANQVASARVATAEARPDALDIASACGEIADASSATPDIAPGGHRRRVLAYLAPLAAAAALPFLWPGKHDDGRLAFEYQIEHGPTRARGTAHVGDVLRLTARGQRHRAIWVYFEKHDLVAACPGSGQCSDADGELVLRIILKEPGAYTAVVLASDDAIAPPAPDKTLDELLAAHNSGIHNERHTVEVD